MVGDLADAMALVLKKINFVVRALGIFWALCMGAFARNADDSGRIY